MKHIAPISTALGLALALGVATSASAAEMLPANLANDPIAKALGAKVINAAQKEGKLVWYGGSTLRKFLKKGKGKARFAKRFGLKIEEVIADNAAIYQRIKTESAVGRQVGDVFSGNEQYANRMIKEKIADSWHPPMTELDNLLPWVTVNVRGKDQFFPVSVSAQSLMVNTEVVGAKDYPKSYWDIVNNPDKWKGKIAIRDPRSASGGAWMMMAIKHHPKLGLDYIKKLAALKPSLVTGGSKRLRNVIAKKQFHLGFSGRGEFIIDLPKGTPVEYVVPKEGFQWTRNGMVRLTKSPNSNASKVLMAWFFQVENLQAWNDTAGRAVPHPKIKAKIPQMSVVAYPAMPPIPEKNFNNPNPFFKEMEQIFGLR